MGTWLCRNFVSVINGCTCAGRRQLFLFSKFLFSPFTFTCVIIVQYYGPMEMVHQRCRFIFICNIPTCFSPPVYDLIYISVCLIFWRIQYCFLHFMCMYMYIWNSHIIKSLIRQINIIFAIAEWNCLHVLGPAWINKYVFFFFGFFIHGSIPIII